MFDFFRIASISSLQHTGWWSRFMSSEYSMKKTSEIELYAFWTIRNVSWSGPGALFGADVKIAFCSSGEYLDEQKDRSSIIFWTSCFFFFAMLAKITSDWSEISISMSLIMMTWSWLDDDFFWCLEIYLHVYSEIKTVNILMFVAQFYDTTLNLFEVNDTLTHEEIKRKSITKWKKLISKSFSIVLVKYEKNHIYRMLRFNEIIYRVSSVIWIKKKREESLVEIANEISAKRSIIELIEFSTKKQALKSNSIIIFMFSFNQSIVVVSFSSVLFTAKVNTSSIESTSSISIFSALKRHFELRYRFDFFDSLNILIMKCMKNVINSQQILKSRLYKKIMNDLNRDKWLKIMKNENKSLLINEIWKLIDFFKDRLIFRDKWVYKIKHKEHDEILRYKTRWIVRDFE